MRKEIPGRAGSTLGSGFVIDASGLVVTNNHVIDGADEIFVIFNDGTKLEAQIVGGGQKNRSGAFGSKT